MWADGEQRNHEPGTKWVDPVEFYHLQDISRTDFQRDYDKGDIDFNKVMKDKGVKVYGLRLKPVAATWYAKKFLPKMAPPGAVFEFRDHQSTYGVWGVPINEASFCVYFDESVSRSYRFSCESKITYAKGGSETAHETLTFDYNGLRLVQTDAGIGFSYTFGGNRSGTNHRVNKAGSTRDEPFYGEFKKEDGVNEKLAHFIYFKDAGNLLVILGATHPGAKKAKSAEEQAVANRPWPRVYFIVEQILVEASAAAAEEAAITGNPQEPVEGEQGLSAEDRTELANFVSDLVAWLKGEGDPFGLGEHTDATESAVINSIATIVSILTGAGIAGFIGSTGASIASGMTDAILSGAAGSMPPPAPNVPNPPNIDGIQPPKRPEEQEKEGEAPPPPPTEPPAPDPFASETFKKYVTKDADGDLIVRDPATGKETIYTNNGDGTYHNLTTKQDWTPAEIDDHLGYRDRNSVNLRQDAELAAKWKAEQRAQWDAQNERDRERGYSDEMKEFRDWKAAQEAAEKKQERIEELAKKYGVPPKEESIKKAIRLEQSIESAFAEENRKLGDSFEKWEKSMKVVDKTCEIGVNVMATCVPGGEAVKDAYTFAKSTLVAASEAVAEGKSAGEGVAHVLVGMGNGALGVIQNQAGNLTEGKSYALLREYGITVGTEGLKDGMTKYFEKGDIGKAYSATLNAIGKKSAEFGISKGIGAVFGFVKDSAKQTLNPGSATIDTDTGFRFSNPNTAKTIDKWLNKTHSGSAGHRADVYKIKVDDAGKVSWGGKGQGFSIFYSGKIDTGKLAEGVVNETLNQSGVYDPAGTLASGLGNDVVNFAKDVKEFSNKAASFRKK